jgi:hypothetical protein
MTKDVEKVLKNVLKFQHPELAALIATFIVKIKPLQIKAALQLYGQPQARAAVSLLIVGPHCLPHESRYEKMCMLKIVNEIICKYIPGLEVNTPTQIVVTHAPYIHTLQVSSLRHVVDYLSKKAAERHVSLDRISHNNIEVEPFS